MGIGLRLFFLSDGMRFSVRFSLQKTSAKYQYPPKAQAARAGRDCKRQIIMTQNDTGEEEERKERCPERHAVDSGKVVLYRIADKIGIILKVHFV